MFCKNILNTVQEALPQSKKPCNESCWSHWSLPVVQHPVTSQPIKLYPYKTSRMGSIKGLIFQILFHRLRCSGRSASTTTCSGSVDLLQQQATPFIIDVPVFPFCSVSPQAQTGLGLASVEWPSRSCRIRLKIFFIGEEVYTFVIN